jgi:hypothetical protein
MIDHVGEIGWASITVSGDLDWGFVHAALLLYGHSFCPQFVMN